MYCSRCKKKLTKEEEEFAEFQWLMNLQTQRLGHVVVNKVPITEKMAPALRTRQSTIVSYCQDCLKQKLMDYIFEEEKPKLKLIVGGLS